MVTIKQLDFDTLAEQSVTGLKVPNGWCHAGMVFVEYGQGFALDSQCQTVNLGNMAQVELYLKHGIGNFHPRQLEALEIVRKVEAQVGRVQANEHKVESTTGKRAINTSGKRARTIRNAEFRPVNTRHLKARKTFSIRKA